MGGFQVTLLILIILMIVVVCVFGMAYLLESFHGNNSLLTAGVPEVPMISARMPVYAYFPDLQNANMKGRLQGKLRENLEKLPGLTVDKYRVYPLLSLMSVQRTRQGIALLSSGPMEDDGVLMSISGQCRMTLLSCWGVDCQGLTSFLTTEPMSLIRDMDDSKMALSSSHISKAIMLSEDQYDTLSKRTQIRLSPEDGGVDLDFGPPPRKVYPLVIIGRCEDTGEEDDHQTQVIGAVWILHLPDESFSCKAYLISQMIVTSQGQVHYLQKMFMASDTNISNGSPVTGTSADSHFEADNDFENISSDDLHDCTVCQNGPISQVVLPCRHACICERCLHLVSKCPMCRGTIASHFRICDPNGQFYPGIEEDSIIHDRHVLTDTYVERFQNFCERINQIMGF